MPFDQYVNDVHVVSSYDVKSIDNGRVNFANGSWCDVGKPLIKNTGNGTIKVGDLTSAGPNGDLTGTRADIITRRLEFAANALDLAVETAEVGIERYPSDQTERPEKITVAITGHKYLAEGVTVREMNGKLFITELSDSLNGNTVVQSDNIFSRIYHGFLNAFRRGNTSAVVGSSITDGQPIIKICVTIPDGTSVKLTTGSSSAAVGDTYGELTLTVNGSGDAEIGQVTDLDLIVNDSGDATVQEVQGKVIIEHDGSGKVHIKRGIIDALAVHSHASGGTIIDAEAQEAVLSNKASGSIFVAHVVETPVINRQGTGKIIVRRTG